MPRRTRAERAGVTVVLCAHPGPCNTEGAAVDDDELESQADPTLDHECGHCGRFHRTKRDADQCCGRGVQMSSD